jgi:hypothetical protein
MMRNLRFLVAAPGGSPETLRGLPLQRACRAGQGYPGDMTKYSTKSNTYE